MTSPTSPYQKTTTNDETKLQNKSILIAILII